MTGLTQLQEVLSGKTIKCNQNPKMNMHYIENVNVAFKFMESEKVKFKGWQPNGALIDRLTSASLSLSLSGHRPRHRPEPKVPPRPRVGSPAEVPVQGGGR